MRDDRARDIRCAATTVSISSRAVYSAAMHSRCIGTVEIVIGRVVKVSKIGIEVTNPSRSIVSFMNFRAMRRATSGSRLG